MDRFVLMVVLPLIAATAGLLVFLTGAKVMSQHYCDQAVKRGFVTW